MGFMTDKWMGEEYFKVDDFDHLEFYVGNAKQVALHFQHKILDDQNHQP